MQIFLNKDVLQYYKIRGWLNPRMWSWGYGGLTVKLYADFQLGNGGSGLVGIPKRPCCSKVNCNNVRIGSLERMSSQFLIISSQQGSVNYNPDTKFGPSPVCINSFTGRQPHLFIYLLSVAVFTLQEQS